MKGRGTPGNPANRFERIHWEPIQEDGVPPPSVPTQYFRDSSRTILSENRSPDLGFRWSVNPYRGCEHGCIYCYARPSHEYLGFGAGLDFESRILVKEDAPKLLRRAFLSRRWKPEMVALSGNTDCYQPIERELRITRDCLGLFRDFRNPVAIVTKSALIQRDIDILQELAAFDLVRVFISVTTLDPKLSGRLEPRAARPEKRIETIRALADARIPVGGFMAPVIPGLTDWEIGAILEALAGAGARSASWALLRLPPPVDRLFVDWLARHYPQRSGRVIGRIRDCRSGGMSDSRFGLRLRGEGIYAGQIAALFRTAARRSGLPARLPPPSTRLFRRPSQPGRQGELFGTKGITR